MAMERAALASAPVMGGGGGVPEPSSVLLLGIALVALTALARDSR